jgi:hypothetical protein
MLKRRPTYKHKSTEVCMLKRRPTYANVLRVYNVCMLKRRPMYVRTQMRIQRIRNRRNSDSTQLSEPAPHILQTVPKGLQMLATMSDRNTCTSDEIRTQATLTPTGDEIRTYRQHSRLPVISTIHTCYDLLDCRTRSVWLLSRDTNPTPDLCRLRPV